MDCPTSHEARGRPQQLELADIVRAHAHELEHVSSEQAKALEAIVNCRTATLGGHVRDCDLNCGYREISYNSCRNRHCPKCQGLAELRWVESRQADLLPVEYFHEVFTIPAELHPLFRSAPGRCYSPLFGAVSDTLQEVAAREPRLGGQIGALAVLHTWSQTLLYHPHIHCIVPGGALRVASGEFVRARKGFFLPVRKLGIVFRAKLLSRLEQEFLSGQQTDSSKAEEIRVALQKAARKKWNVYAKPSFGGPEHVIRYLGRYTHRIAISEARLVSDEAGQVTFNYKDRTGEVERQRQMTLPAVEFLRRFLLHLLPSGFVRVRYFGFLANGVRKERLALIRALLGLSADQIPPPAPEKQGWEEDFKRLTGRDIRQCPRCKHGHLVDRGRLEASPLKWRHPGRSSSP